MTGWQLGEVLGGDAFDITERTLSESRIAYLNRVYALLSGINNLIVRVRDLEELFRESCRIAISPGGFPLAMIGMLDRSAMKIITVAMQGKDPWVVTAVKA